MRNWTPAIPIGAALAFSAAIFTRLPEQVRPELGPLLPFALPDSGETLPRIIAALLFPTVALLLWGFLAWVGRIKAPQRPFPAWLLSEDTDATSVAKFASTYHTIMFTLAAGMSAVHVVLLGSSIGWPSWTLQLFTAAIGLALLAVGNVIPRSRPNWIVGIRTKGTLSSAAVWARTHRYAGMFMMVTGALVIVASVIAPSYALLVALGGIVLSLPVAHAMGARNPGNGTAPGLTIGFVITMALPFVATSAQAPADTLAPRDVVEREMTIPTADITLPATLAMPAETGTPIPIVIIVAGSGPTDRNANGPLVQTNAYAQIAWQLAQHGVATLRYDKRGIGESARTLDHTQLSVPHYVSDVSRAVAAVRGDARFSRLYLLGHSEGAMLVLLAANGGAAVDGVIMMSGTGRKLGDVIHDQLKTQVDSATLVQIDVAWQRFMAGEDPGTVPAIAQALFVPTYRRMLQSMAAYEPARELRRATVPVMLIQGGMDWQVTMDDASQLRAAKPDATWLFIPEANHVFKPATSPLPADQVPSYHDKTIPIVPNLVPAIADFVKTARNRG